MKVTERSFQFKHRIIIKKKKTTTNNCQQNLIHNNKFDKTTRKIN